MSDSQGLGTTTVLPPAGPGGTPPTGTSSGNRGPREGVPVWVFVVTLLAVALIVGTLVWLLSGSRPPVATVTASTPTVTVETTQPATVTTTTPVATPTVTPKPKPKPTPLTVREPALVKMVTWSTSKGYQITVDYVQILTGKAAADAATAAGQESPPPNDYFIVNASKKLRTFALPKSASIVVLGWAGADSNVKKSLPVGQFMDIMPGGVSTQAPWSTAYYYVTVKGTTVTKVEQIYLP
jgi:hypothetical protein